MMASVNLINNIPLLQSDIDRISAWALKWSVTFNVDKSMFMTISRRQMPSPISLEFNGNKIKQVTKHKHLGLTFNSQANWSDHMNTQEDDGKPSGRLAVHMGMVRRH